MVAQWLDVLGTMVDSQLTFRGLLERTCARLLASTTELRTSIHDLGLGAPLAVDQFCKRVCPSVLHGTEPLASFSGGWPVAARRLNDAMYSAVKVLLGLRPGVSLGAGGYVKAFSETRLFTRVAAMVLQLILTTRARLDLLPDDTLARRACRGTRTVVGCTWLDHVGALVS